MTQTNMQGQYAGCVTRLIAWLIDTVVITVVITVVLWLTNFLAGFFNINIGQCPVPIYWMDIAGIVCWGVVIWIILFSLLFGPLYMIFMWTLTGQTVGKIFVGVRVVRMDGRRMTFRASIRRYIGYLLSFVGFGLGFLWILFDNQRRGWHDKIAHTCVVYSWNARQNNPLVDRLTLVLFRRRQQVSELADRIEATTGEMAETVKEIPKKNQV